MEYMPIEQGTFDDSKLNDEGRGAVEACNEAMDLLQEREY
jgi:hypothetical protein